MKVAILSFYSGLVSRGVETFVHELASTLASSSAVDLTVYQAGPQLPSAKYRSVTVPFKLRQSPDATNSLCRYLFLDYYSRQIKNFTVKALHQLKSDPPDILLPLNNGWMTWLSKRFCRFRKTKLVLAGFSGIGWDDKLNLWLNPDTFIACTQSQAGWAKSINPRAKVATINIGVNTDRFKPQGKKYSSSLKPPIVLTVAGPQKYKRTDLAIQAVSQLKSASLLVVGPQPDHINHLGKQLLGSRYQNIQIDYQHLDPVYRAADVFTLPSESSEAYGISILEALATNLPVVVNRDPIRQELVGQAGILLDPTDISAYSQALDKLIKQPLGQKPRQQALKFSWDKIAQQHLQLWQNLTA